MTRKLSHTRRELMTGSLTAGAAFMFSKVAKGGENSNPLGDFEIPLATQRIPQPDSGNCLWAGFSPVNDQSAFMMGMNDKIELYVSQSGQPGIFNLLWETKDNRCRIRSAVWSPNGQEIAFLVQKFPDEAVDKSFIIYLIYIIDVVSGKVSGPINIKNITGKGVTAHTNIIFAGDGIFSANHLCWRGDSCVCVAADDGSVLKIDKSSGQSVTLLVPPENGAYISGIALTRTGEVRFVKTQKPERGKGSEFEICGLKQDGTVCDYGNLNEQFGRIVDTRLSQDGNFIFFPKIGKKVLQMKFTPVIYFIYKIEDRSIVGQIPAVVNHKNGVYEDTYIYIPIDVQNDRELILIEALSAKADGGKSMRNPIMKAAKINLL
jgi:hypothetical protein